MLKGLVKDVRLTPSRALLTEYLLMVLDALDDATRLDVQIGALAHVGGPKLVDIFMLQLSKNAEGPVKPMLRNYRNVKKDSHQSTYNRLQRDTRSHPNGRFSLELTALSNDADTLHERLFYLTLFRGCSVDAKEHIKLTGWEEEPIREPHHSNADKAVLAGVSDFMSSIRVRGDASGEST